MDLMYAILDNFPEISPLWLVLGEGEMFRECDVAQECVSAPFFSDMPVSAGLRDSFDPSMEKANGYISLPSQKANFYFPVSGTSMEPEVFSGDIVGVVRVGHYDKISPEAIYMIVTNENRMIKHCYIDENNPELLWCVSPNYPSFPINRADICAMFRVVSRIQYF
jgi:phage repressor protein C with HTH and peptisase S24 domain